MGSSPDAQANHKQGGGGRHKPPRPAPPRPAPPRPAPPRPAPPRPAPRLERCGREGLVGDEELEVRAAAGPVVGVLHVKLRVRAGEQALCVRARAGRGEE